MTERAGIFGEFGPFAKPWCGRGRVNRVKRKNAVVVIFSRPSWLYLGVLHQEHPKAINIFSVKVIRSQ